MTTIQIIKWISGVLLAGILTLGSTIVIFHHVVNVDMNNLTPFQFWISDFFLSLAFGLFLFFACWFAPVRKRNAGLFVIIFSVLFIAMGVYNHVVYDGHLGQDHIIRYSSFILFLLISMYISRKLFVSKNW